jgi:dolichyl-phosphate-mannose--protein O-mannosyl transferase
LIGSRGRRFSDSPLLVLTTAQEGIGMRSISIASGIFSLYFWFFYLLVMSLNMLGEALSMIIVLTGGSLITDGRVTKKFRKEKLRSNNSNDRN